VDESNEPTVAQTRLIWWRTEVARLFAGDPQHPVTRALGPCLEPFGLDQARLQAVIDGMQMDLDQARYSRFRDLEVYCDRVAGVVGTMAADIFGRKAESTRAYAQALGLAFQLTNIIRDVGEDARKGRIYLPVEDLQRFGVLAADLLQGRTSPEFIELMRFQAERNRAQYARAYGLLADEDRRAQRPGLIMSSIYSTLLDEIEVDGFRVLTHRTSLTPIRKLWLAWKTWLTARPPDLQLARS
jgi:phytoene synthase